MSLIIGAEEKSKLESLDDDKRAESVLSSLRNKVRAAASNVPKVVEVGKDVTRFRCKNHTIMTVIDMSDSQQRVYGAKITPEFICSCGTIYKRV